MSLAQPEGSYPPDFFDWPLDRRNEYFANEAAAYDRRKRADAEAQKAAKARRSATQTIQQPEAPPPDEPPNAGANRRQLGKGEDAKPFPLEMWADISFDLDEEYLIDGVMPRQGVGLIFGASQTFKSFIALDAALRVAQGLPWAGRTTEMSSVVYLAAEGAAGIRKRREGNVRTGRTPAQGVGFALISAAPNLGAASDDYERLVSTIEAAGLKPGLIVLDTIAKAIGGADENGAGMAQFLINAERLAQHFNCFVLCVHHVGYDANSKDRPRGWSGLPAALDLQMFAQRNHGELSATVTLQKLKDEPSGVRFEARLERVVFGASKTGREVSTLVVSEVIETAAPAAAPKPKSVPRSQRLLRDTLAQALDEAGENVKPFANGPILKAVDAERARARYYAAIAEKSDADEDEHRLAERQRRAFNRTLEAAITANDLCSREIDGRRMLWLP